MFCFVFSGTHGRFEWSGVQKGQKKRERNIGFSPRRDVAAFKTSETSKKYFKFDIVIR